MLGETVQAAPDDPTTEVLIEKTVDRHAGRAGNTFDDLVWNEWVAGAVLEHRQIQDDVLGRQPRKRREQLLQGGL